MTSRLILVSAVSAMIASGLLTSLLRKIALARGLLDIPNKRSSHLVPTPTGGGAAIVLAATAACAALWARGGLETDVLLALLGGLVVATTGFVDDWHELKAGLRLVVHMIAAVWALVWLGGLPPLSIGNEPLSFGAVGYAVGVLGIVWVINLFNFMDGIDGLAASEGVFVTWGGALLATLVTAIHGVSEAACLVGAACAGFLLWNWPPAKIFLGDVGSGYLGYVIAVLALAAARLDPVALYAWVILGGVFWVDATLTLVRRTLRGEALHRAHCSHAYQGLARRWGRHQPVTLTVVGINILWLFPWALFVELHPKWAPLSTLAALIPLAVLATIAGAGGRERARE
jgi:Fuc2NAc and GlcNAc transferase